MYDLIMLTIPGDGLSLFLYKMCAITNRENIISFKLRQNYIYYYFYSTY